MTTRRWHWQPRLPVAVPKEYKLCWDAELVHSVGAALIAAAAGAVADAHCNGNLSERNNCRSAKQCSDGREWEGEREKEKELKAQAMVIDWDTCKWSAPVDTHGSPLPTYANLQHRQPLSSPTVVTLTTTVFARRVRLIWIFLVHASFSRKTSKLTSGQLAVLTMKYCSPLVRMQCRTVQLRQKSCFLVCFYYTENSMYNASMNSQAVVEREKSPSK
mgnify:CR=1 FL=1